MPKTNGDGLFIKSSRILVADSTLGGHPEFIVGSRA